MHRAVADPMEGKSDAVVSCDGKEVTSKVVPYCQSLTLDALRSVNVGRNGALGARAGTHFCPLTDLTATPMVTAMKQVSHNNDARALRADLLLLLNRL